MNTPQTLTDKQVTTNIWALRIFAFSDYGYLFAIPVMLNYVTRNTDGAPENYFYMSTISVTISILTLLFVGAFADLHKRRSMLLVKAFARACVWALFAFYPSFLTMMLALLLMLSVSSIANTSACLYETMQASTRKDDYKKEESQQAAFSQYAMAAVFPFVGYFYESMPTAPFLMNIAVTVLAFGATLLYTEAPREHAQHRSVIKQLKEVAGFLKLSPHVTAFLVFYSLVAAFASFFLFIIQARFFEIGGTVFAFSIITPLIYFTRGVGAQMSAKFANLFKDALANQMFLTVCGGLLIFSFAFIENVWVYAAATLLFMLFRALQIPALSAIMNHILPSDKRVTAYSASTFIKRFKVAGLDAIAGTVIALWSASMAMGIFGFIFTGIGCGVLLMLSHRNGRYSLNDKMEKA